jgi:hypothetical protein
MKQVIVYFTPRYYKMFIADCYINGYKKSTYLRMLILNYYDKSN